MAELNVFAVVLYIVFGIAIPIGLLIFMRLKLRAKLKPFIVGGLTWLLFAIMVEGSVHAIVFSVFPNLQSNILLYAVYGGLMAGIFEELGRYLAFKIILKRELGNDKNALVYAAGHGGFEAFYILVMGAVNLIVMAALINSGSGAELGDQLSTAVASVKSLTVPTALLGIFERFSAVIAHFAFTVYVWFAVKEGKMGLMFLAILLHAVLDAAAVIAAQYLPVLAVEAIIFALSLAFSLLARYIWKKYHTSEVTEL